MERTHDVIVIGGGLGGAVTAKKLAEAGKSVLVLERETAFRDRVRGEQMHCWGAAAARRLGVYDTLMSSCGHDTRYWNTYVGGNLVGARDLHETTPHRVGSTNFLHPRMQEAMLGAAIEAGADVKRGAVVESLSPGETPSVSYAIDGARRTATAWVVIAADGRTSRARAWGGFEVRRDPELLRIAGTLLENTSAPRDAVHLCVGPEGWLLLAPHGDGRARAYFIRPTQDPKRLSGPEAIPAFVAACRNTGAPSDWFDGAQITGPLAEFEGAEHSVEHPVRGGVALIGDAAAALDPSWGCGLSKTLLDVEALTDALLSTDDRDAALDRYAAKHRAHYRILHDIEAAMVTMMWTPGPEGDRRRDRAMPRFLAGDPRFPDIIGLGPQGPHDETALSLLRGD